MMNVCDARPPIHAVQILRYMPQLIDRTYALCPDIAKNCPKLRIQIPFKSIPSSVRNLTMQPEVTISVNDFYYSLTNYMIKVDLLACDRQYKQGIWCTNTCLKYRVPNQKLRSKKDSDHSWFMKESKPSKYEEGREESYVGSSYLKINPDNQRATLPRYYIQCSRLLKNPKYHFVFSFVHMFEPNFIYALYVSEAIHVY